MILGKDNAVWLHCSVNVCTVIDLSPFTERLRDCQHDALCDPAISFSIIKLEGLRILCHFLIL